MSGGSFDYLYVKGDDHVAPLLGTFREMERTLVTLGRSSSKALDDVRLLIAALELACGLNRRLSDVFHDVEWFVSCDYSEEQAREACEKYAARTT